MMMAFGLMCSAGGATFFSLLSGQGETRRMHKAFGNAFVLVCGWEILLTVFLLVLADPLLVLFGVTDTAYPYAIAYYRIVALGCLFQGCPSCSATSCGCPASRCWACASPASAP